MESFLHFSHWRRLAPAVLFVAVAFVLSGCDDGKTSGSAAAPSPEAVKAQDQMNEFMKKTPNFGKGSTKPKINRGPVLKD